MSNLPEKREGVIKNQFKLISSDKKEYILTEYITTDTISIYIGGKTKYCIQGQLYKKDSPFSRILDVTEGILLHLYYDKECDLTDTFERNTDTHKLLQILISYIKHNYPYITKLKFNDASTRTCDNGSTVDLSIMSFLIYGKTWYERHFNAYLDEKDREPFIRAVTDYNTKKQKIDWGMMKSYILTDFPLPENQMEKLYNNSPLWQDFFYGINKQIGISGFCMFISPWIHGFINPNFKFNVKYATYIFPIDNSAFKPYAKYNSVKYGGYTKRKTIKFRTKRNIK